MAKNNLNQFLIIEREETHVPPHTIVYDILNFFQN